MKPKSLIPEPLTTTLATAEAVVDEVAKTTDTLVEPYRRSAAKRYPVLFLLLVTTGVSATLIAIEQIISSWLWLYDKPFLLLVIGLGILVATGTLYKKLG